MKCMNCQTEIDPRWTHALNSNMCPNCGGEIMASNLKDLLASLKDTMQALQEYPQELNDWMLSNHSYIKTDSPDLIKYLPEDTLKEMNKASRDKDRESKKSIIKIKNAKGEIEEIEVEKTQPEEKTDEFFKRAGIISKNPKTNKNPNAPPTSFGSVAEKTAHLKEMANQIKKAGSSGMMLDGDGMLLSSDTLDNPDPNDVAELQAAIGGGEEYAPPTHDEGRDDIAVPSFVLRANQAIGGNRGGVDKNAVDREYLAKLEERVNNPGATLGAGCFSRG